MALILTVQELINGVCLYEAQKRGAEPEDFEAEIVYDDDFPQPFLAEVTYRGVTEDLLMPELVAAIRLYLEQYTDVDPLSASVDLQLTDDEEFIAVID
ncbi:DUF2653 family protein [Savagea sp. SN6]|uniref:DUF2653 family protein n=1 Tax=Savagea serpentis TaxID=2785297 RepID=A0A8J7G3K4_9BACL|nr:DUF2653 family protein [Savagea serpentis]MBF4500777.1 DUF2653 family protein [Savagea serpentis]